MQNRLVLLNKVIAIRYVYYFIVALIGFTLPISVRYNTLSIVILVIYWAALEVRYFTINSYRPFFYPLLFLFCFYFWGIISLFYTEHYNILKAYHQFAENRLPLLLLPLILFGSDKKLSFITGFSSFLLGLLFFCISLNLDILSKISQQNEPLSFFYLKYVRTSMLEGAKFSMHSMYLSMMMLVALLFNLYFLFNKGFLKSLYLKACVVLVSVYFLMMLYLVGARNSILTLCVLGIICVLYYILSLVTLRINLRFFLSLFIVCLLFVVGLNYKSTVAKKIEDNFNLNHLSWESVPRRTLKFLKYGDNTREIIWQSAIDVIKENLWFGVGAGDSLEEMQKKRPMGSWAYQVGANAHNQYLDITVQQGIVGLFFWLAFYFSLMHHGLKHKNPLLVIFLLIIGIALITESMLQEHRGLVFISFFAPLLSVYKTDTYPR